MNIKKWFWGISTAAILSSTASAVVGVLFSEEVSPFGAAVRRVEFEGRAALKVDLKIPPHHVLYCQEIKLASAGAELTALQTSPVHRKPDPITGETKDVYEGDAFLIFPMPPGDAPVVVLSLMGCDDQTCFLPEQRAFRIAGVAGEQIPLPEEPSVAPDAGTIGPTAALPRVSQVLSEKFTITSREGGYMDVQSFRAFLAGNAVKERGASAVSRGWFWTLLLVVSGGVALNFTPCVLPMIPINLAIIGAGARAGSKRRGFLLGGVYGLGIALAYGVLGLVVVLTKSTFGTLNANPWFNAGMAALFVVLAVSMMGVFNIDFSRFQSSVHTQKLGRGTIALAFSAGAIAALLAGACVAPALIGVLLLAGKLYADGYVLGLALPFLLGAGMALPWPFAGAGLSFLPKPGGWMNYVKYGFGVLILGFGLYYGHLAYSLFCPKAYDPTDEDRRLAAALTRAEREGKPVFLDFWAHWCKNCIAMEKTTFKDPAVQQDLSKFIVVKYQAERPDREPARSLLRSLEIVGLPAYLMIEPKPPTRP